MELVLKCAAWNTVFVFLLTACQRVLSAGHELFQIVLSAGC